MPASKMEVSVLLSLKDKLTSPLRRMGTGFKKMNRTLTASQAKFAALNAQMKLVGTKSMKMGKKLSRNMTLPIIGLGVAMAKTSIDFNKGLANINTLLPGSQERVKKLGDAMLKMSVKTGASTKDLTGGMYQMISAFGDSADVVDKLNLAVMASTAGASTTTDAINLLAAVTKGYGDTSSKAMKQTSDFAFTTVKLGQTTFPELARSMGAVVPIAKALGVSQKELFGTFATLTGVTGNTSEVATQVRGAMAALLKPTTDMKKAVTGLGFASADGMIKQLGLVGSLRKLIATTGGSKEKMAALFGRVEALNGVMALTGSQAKVFDAKFKQMGKTAGATDAAFNAQTKGLNKSGFAWKKMIASVKVLAIKLGRLLLPVVEALSKVFGTLANIIGSLPKPFKLLLVALGGIAAAIGPALLLFSTYKKMKVGFDVAKIAFKKFSRVMSKSPMFLKLTLLIVAVTLIVSLFKKSTISIKENQRASETLSNEVKGLANSYTLAAKGAKKLTEEQRLQMKLQMLTANEKSIKQIKSNYDKMIKLEDKLGEEKKGTIAYEKVKTKLGLLQFAQKTSKQTFATSQKFLGRTGTKERLQGMQKGYESDRVSSGMFSSMSRTIGAFRNKMQAQRDKPSPVDAIFKSMFSGKEKEKATPLTGKISINIKSDGTVGTTNAIFPGTTLNALISAKSVKNGRTR